MPPVLVDLSHTSHTRARTGVQRVARSLRNALGAEAIAPGAGAGLNADVRFDAAAPDFPLVLGRLDLAGVHGEAHCSLRAGGPFRLNLRGEIAPRLTRC